MFIILKIPNKCPYCGGVVPSLQYYQIAEDVPYKFAGEFILTTSNKKLHFIRAKGYCEACAKSYNADVGISKSCLTKIIKTHKSTKDDR